MAAIRPGARRHSDDALLDGAVAEFGSVGYRAASMLAIAERASTTKPTLYARFGPKDALYAECLARAADRFKSWLFAAYRQATDLPPLEEVRADVHAVFAFASQYPDEFRLLFSEDSSDPIAISHRNRLEEDLTDRVADLVLTSRHMPPDMNKAEVGLLAALIVSIAVQAARRACLRGTVDPQIASTMATELAFAGLNKVGRTSSSSGR